jgi:hypothetical protein
VANLNEDEKNTLAVTRYWFENQKKVRAVVTKLMKSFNDEDVSRLTGIPLGDVPNYINKTRRVTSVRQAIDESNGTPEEKTVLHDFLDEHIPTVERNAINDLGPSKKTQKMMEKVEFASEDVPEVTATISDRAHRLANSVIDKYECAEPGTKICERKEAETEFGETSRVVVKAWQILKEKKFIETRRGHGSFIL